MKFDELEAKMRVFETAGDCGRRAPARRGLRELVDRQIPADA